MKTKRNKVQELSINTTLLIFVIILFFLLLEISIRFIENSGGKLVCEHSFLSIHEKSNDTLLAYELIPNKTSDYECVHNYINAQGIRVNNINDIYPEKSEKFRIITVGDSVSYGFRREYNETFPFMLEKYMNDNGFDTEVINMGVTGYNVEQNVEMINARAINFNPDLIIIGYVHNDYLIGDSYYSLLFEKNITCRLLFTPIKINCFTLQKVNNIRSVMFINEAFKNIFNKVKKDNDDSLEFKYDAWTLDPTRNDFPRYLDSLKKIENISKQHNIVVVILPLATNWSEDIFLRNRVMPYLTPLNLTVLDGLKAFEDFNPSFIADGNDKVHYSVEGFRLLGKFVGDYIIQNREKYNLTKT